MANNEKILNSRLQQKHDIEANWIKATNFRPKPGEIIIYDADENYSYPRVKIGNLAEDLINDLPFLPSGGDSGIYIGSGEMPEGYNIQIDPNGDTLEAEDIYGHIENTNNPHKITPELIKALSSQAKRIENLDEATETGIYIGRIPKFEEAYSQDFYCITIGEGEDEDRYKIQLCFGEQDITGYSAPCMLIRIMFDWNDEKEPSWTWYRYITEEEFYENIGNVVTYDCLWDELDFYMNENAGWIVDMGMSEFPIRREIHFDNGDLMIVSDNVIEFFGTAFAVLGRDYINEGFDGLLLDYSVPFSVVGNKYNIQATVGYGEYNEYITSTSAAGMDGFEDSLVQFWMTSEVPEGERSRVSLDIHITAWYEEEEE